MNKKYKIDNLWLVKLGETTEFKNGGRREGYTKWRELPQIYFAKKIETELEYPGQIKVNVIREFRGVEYAK